MTAILKPIPASFFTIVLGLIGLGGSWRIAAGLWGAPAWIGEAILASGALVWLLLVMLYVAKWLWARADAVAELNHPVQCCFISLIAVSTLLVAGAVLPYSRPAALTLFGLGVIGQLGFGLYRTGQLWRGGRDPGDTTPIMYLPLGAGNFVTAVIAGALGYGDLGRLFFGAGFFSALALESVILNRLYVQESLATALRPTLGIQLAPSVVGCVAYLSVTNGPPDLFAQLLLGYGILQLLILLRLLPWIMQQAFNAAYWAFTFGVAALAISAMRFVERGLTGIYEPIALVVFGVANLVIGIVALGTLALLLQGRLIPPRVPATIAR